jgi:hypothetical protein
MISHAFWGPRGSTWPSWGAILAELEDVPCVLGGSGRFLMDVSHGLGDPVGRESLGIRARAGSGIGFGGPAGRGKPDKRTEGSGSAGMWIGGQGDVQDSEEKTVLYSLGGPWQAGAGGYMYIYIYVYIYNTMCCLI